MGLEGIHNTPTGVPTDLGCRGRAYWDVETRNLITESKQQHDWVVISVTFSHDGKLIATGSRDNTIRL